MAANKSYYYKLGMLLGLCDNKLADFGSTYPEEPIKDLCRPSPVPRSPEMEDVPQEENVTTGLREALDSAQRDSDYLKRLSRVELGSLKEHFTI